MQKEIRKTISKIKETGLQLLFPGRCPVCDGIVRPFGRKICPECLPKLKPVTAPWCMRCGKKLAEEREYCGDCMHREHKYDRARTLYEYRDVAPSIYRFKYSGRQEYGDFFGEEMARLLGDFIGRVRPDVIVPVPLYRGKLRKRGYNQAACLARALGRSLELPVDEKLVKRVRNTLGNRRTPVRHSCGFCPQARALFKPIAAILRAASAAFLGSATGSNRAALAVVRAAALSCATTACGALLVGADIAAAHLNLALLAQLSITPTFRVTYNKMYALYAGIQDPYKHHWGFTSHCSQLLLDPYDRLLVIIILHWTYPYSFAD